MRERQLRRLLDVKQDDRFPIIGEGLARLGEHVDGLAKSVVTLESAGDIRGAAALDIICTEEAAKILILLDMSRSMHKQKEFTKCFRDFYDHLPRAIYAYVHESNPSLYAEVMGYVEDCRPSHYLDGPNDADWIFRNSLKRQRETTLYVDYEETEPGKYEWTGGDPELVQVSRPITRLVLAMRTAGMLTEAGARAVAIAWANSSFDESTRWEYCRDRNTRVLQALVTAETEATRELADAWRTVQEKWTFPLTKLNLSVDDSTTIDQLKDEQAGYYNRMMLDEMGPLDYRDY
ncbi:AbiV family abortive infection protein [Arthrobacter sp. 2MCAF14]